MTQFSLEHKRHRSVDVSAACAVMTHESIQPNLLLCGSGSNPHGFGRASTGRRAGGLPQDPGEGTAFPRTAPTLGDGTVIEAKRLSSVLGIDVRTDAERNVGRIIDLLANRDGHVEAAVIEFGGFLGMGTRKIAIDWSALHLETNDKKTVAVLDMNRDQLRAAPEYKPDEPVVVRKIGPPSADLRKRPSRNDNSDTIREAGAADEAQAPPSYAQSRLGCSTAGTAYPSSIVAICAGLLSLPITNNGHRAWTYLVDVQELVNLDGCGIKGNGIQQFQVAAEGVRRRCRHKSCGLHEGG